jgi:hypothetical protein
LNENRIVYYQKVKQWIQKINFLNTSLKNQNKPLFNPTTVMQIGSKKYLFVINKAKLNSKGHIVFKVSTEEIKLSDKKMLKLPRGHHDRVRFDIDGGGLMQLGCPQAGTDVGSCPGYICACPGTTCTAGEDGSLGHNWSCTSSNRWVRTSRT